MYYKFNIYKLWKINKIIYFNKLIFIKNKLINSINVYEIYEHYKLKFFKY